MMGMTNEQYNRLIEIMQDIPFRYGKQLESILVTMRPVREESCTPKPSEK